MQSGTGNHSKRKKMLDNMLETMYATNGVGLAAPQIGVLKRMVVIDVGEARPRPAEAD